MDFSKIRNYLFLGLLGVVTILFLFLLKPFAYPIFWAAVIAGIFYPLYQRFTRLIKSPNLSATLTLIVVVLIIIIPVLAVGRLVIAETVDLYQKFNDNIARLQQTVGVAIEAIRNNPLTARLDIDEAFVMQRVAETARSVVDFLFASAREFTENSVRFVVLFVIMLYSLFFFIRDGQRLLQKIMYLCPLGDKYEKLLYNKFTAAAQASLKGSLVIGLIQGTLGGILFAIVGIPGALIWGIIMVLFSLIPGLGSFIIWFPAAVIMLVIGNIWQGIIMILVGTLLIGTIDNFLRPLLVGKGLQIHPLLILFSTLGGLALFGVSGFIIGPIVASLFMAFWEMYEHYYQNELRHN